MSKTGVTRIIPIIQTGARISPSPRDSPVQVVNAKENGNTVHERQPSGQSSVNNSRQSSEHPIERQSELAAPSSYNHRREASPAYKNKAPEFDDTTDEPAEPARSVTPIPLPAKEEVASRSDEGACEDGRQNSVDDVIGEKVINMLDEIERRVELLRSTAHAMEEERESLLEMLGTLQMNKDMLRLGPGERGDVEATMDRLMSRCKTVDVMVNTPRNKDQQRALVTVNEAIEGLVHNINDDIAKGKQTCQRYLNACDPDLVSGAIDQKFQSNVIECTADDQKRIRRRLTQLKTQIERAEKSINPTYQA